MKEKLISIKEAIKEGKLETAIEELSQYIQSDSKNDEAYYLLGNAYRKLGNWQMALNNYLARNVINESIRQRKERQHA